MGALVFSSQILGRQYLAAYGLFLAGFLMLLISPSLLFDIGFQLSFLATLGLLYIKPLIDSLFTKSILKKVPVIEDFSTTITAQVVTFPILLVNFGSYSLWSVVVNALVLWTIPIIMVIGGVGAIVGLLIEPIGQMIIYLCLPLLIYFEKTIVFFSLLGQKFSMENFPWQFTIGYYLMVLALFLGLRTRKAANENRD